LFDSNFFDLGYFEIGLELECFKLIRSYPKSSNYLKDLFY